MRLLDALLRKALELGPDDPLPPPQKHGAEKA
jgi:hypothetical protein